MAEEAKKGTKTIKKKLTGATGAKANNDGRQGAKGDSIVKVTTGGLRPPRIYKEVLERRDVVWFLKAYDEYVRKMRVANEDGNERSTASILELIPETVLDVIAMKYILPDEAKRARVGKAGTSRFKAIGRHG